MDFEKNTLSHWISKILQHLIIKNNKCNAVWLECQFLHETDTSNTNSKIVLNENSTALSPPSYLLYMKKKGIVTMAQNFF